METLIWIVNNPSIIIDEILYHCNVVISRMQDYHASAIHFACDKGHTKVVEMLIEHNSNLNLQTNVSEGLSCVLLELNGLQVN